MAFEITKCEICNSMNITDINPEIRLNPNKVLVTINAKCDDCGSEFEYSDMTDKAKKSGRYW